MAVANNARIGDVSADPTADRSKLTAAIERAKVDDHTAYAKG
jgi:hypothetical protein